MKKAIKKNWLKALRSGEYRKATGSLREFDGIGNAYCCLGVLRCIVPGLRPSGELLSPSACKAVGLPEDDMKMLAALNDNADRVELKSGKSVRVRTTKENAPDFRRVIRYIEKNL